MDDRAAKEDRQTRHFPTLRLGLASAMVLWLAQPPVGWWPLAWVAPIGWLSIIRREQPLDRGDWLRVYLSGVVYWLLAVHWIRLPHPLTILGWPLLCFYLGFYPLGFVWLSRVGLRQARMPLWLVAPIVWTGLELLQARLFTGFLMGAVSHAVAPASGLCQLARYVGAYGISFVWLWFASCIALQMSRGLSEVRVAHTLPTCALLAAILWFVSWGGTVDSDQPQLTVALIQGNTLATWDPDPQRHQKIMNAQTRLSIEAVEKAKAEGKELDLIVWPESMFRVALDTFDGAFEPPTGTREELVQSSEHCQAWFRSLAAKLKTPMLVGIDHYDWTANLEDPAGAPVAKSFNSAALADAEGKVLSVYDKTHRVPFGEYIPLAEGMPAMYYLTPMSGGLKPGAGPVAMELTTKSGETFRLAPSICFESTVPHVIRSHVKELTDLGQTPNLLVNVTNDAWFWGSSELDTHLACARLRAIETGTPMIVAANGGLSAVISPRGEVLAVSPRMEEHVLLADFRVRGNSPPTPYIRYGDWFAGACLIGCGLLAILFVVQRMKPQINTEERGSETAHESNV